MSYYHERMPPMYLPCGGVAEFDDGSDIGHRCTYCFAVVGSIGQPRKCAEEAKKWDAYKKAGMWEWDYLVGKPKVLRKTNE